MTSFLLKLFALGLVLVSAALTAAVTVRTSPDLQRRLRSWRPEPVHAAVLTATVIALVLVVRIFTASSFFVWDDFVNFQEARGTKLSMNYLVRETPGTCCLGLRVAPVHRLTYWLIQEHAPLSFGVVQAVVLACFALTIVLFYWLLAELVGAGWGPLLLTLVYGVSTVHVDVAQWFSAAMDRMPATLFSLVCMIAYVRFFRRRSWQSLALSVTALAVALLFHVKPALVPLYLVLLRVLILGRENTVLESLVAAAREWWVWLVYVAPTAVYLAIYANRYHEALGDPSLSRLARYLLSLWFSVTVPGFFGLLIPRGTSIGLAALGIVVTQLALIVLATVAVVRRRDAWRAGAFFLAAFLLNAVLVGLTRISGDSGPFGPDNVAHALRYSEEIAYLFPLALAAAFMPVRGVERPAAPSRLRVGRRFRGSSGWVTAGLATAICVALSLIGDVQATTETFGPVARRYFANLRRDVDRVASSRTANVALLDGTVPYEVVPPGFAPFHRHSAVLPLTNRRLSFDPRAENLHEVNREGQLRPVTWTSHEGGLLGALLARGAAKVAPEDAVDTSSGSTCVRSDATRALLGWTLARPSPPGGDAYLRVRMHDATAGPSDMAVAAVNRGDRSVLTPDPAARVPRRPSDVVFRLGDSGIAHVLLSLPDRSRVCIEEIEIAVALPRAA